MNLFFHGQRAVAFSASGKSLTSEWANYLSCWKSVTTQARAFPVPDDSDAHSLAYTCPSAMLFARSLESIAFGGIRRRNPTNG